jgi:hypothetical protein
LEIYQANARANCGGKRSKDCESGVEPLFRGAIAAVRLDERLNIIFLVKYVENVGGEFAILEIGGEWMKSEVILCLLAIPFQGITESRVKTGRRNRGSDG